MSNLDNGTPTDGNSPTRQSTAMTSTPPPRMPTLLTSALVIVLLLFASLLSAILTIAVLDDYLASLIVFIFTLTVLVIGIPAIGLLSGTLSEARWFQTYVLSLKLIPGLATILDKLPPLGGSG